MRTRTSSSTYSAGRAPSTATFGACVSSFPIQASSFDPCLNRQEFIIFISLYFAINLPYRYAMSEEQQGEFERIVNYFNKWHKRFHPAFPSPHPMLSRGCVQ